VKTMGYIAVALCACTYFHSSFEEHNPVLAAHLKNARGYRNWPVIVWAPQDIFSGDNKIYSGDKILTADVNNEVGEGKDLDIFKVLEVKYGHMIEEDSLFLELCPRAHSIIRVPDLSSPPVPIASDITPEDNDITPEDNEGTAENGGIYNGE
jgi:hypothetical protein